MARSVDYIIHLIKSLINPAEARAYLKAILEECKDCDEQEARKLLNLAIKHITAAQGSKKCQEILREILACQELKYKGYIGKAEYDDEAKIFHGEVIGLRDVITFQAKNVNDTEKEFQASVDEYLEWCKERGENPEKTKFNFKIHKEKDGYSAQCIELPGCVTQADTMKELRKNMKEALNLILEDEIPDLKDKNETLQYLNRAANDPDTKVFINALKNVVKVRVDTIDESVISLPRIKRVLAQKDPKFWECK